MRTKIEWRSSSKDNYNKFCKKHPSIKLTFDEWRNIIYQYIESYKEYILETGEKAKLPFGFGEFSINKKKRRKVKDVNGKEYINLPVDWKKTKEKGKIIYNFNYHTEGYFSKNQQDLETVIYGISNHLVQPLDCYHTT